MTALDRINDRYGRGTLDNGQPGDGQDAEGLPHEAGAPHVAVHDLLGGVAGSEGVSGRCGGRAGDADYAPFSLR